MIGKEMILDSGRMGQYLAGGALAGVAVFVIALILLFLVGLYVYNALAWQRIGKNQKYKHPWLAWIPFANVSMIFQMGGFHWAWVFLFLIPIAGWLAIIVLLTISIWRIFEKSKYPGWLGLSYTLAMIPYLGMSFGVVYLIVIGVVAWGKNKTTKARKKKTRKG